MLEDKAQSRGGMIPNSQASLRCEWWWISRAVVDKIDNCGTMVPHKIGDGCWQLLFAEDKGEEQRG